MPDPNLLLTWIVGGTAIFVPCALAALLVDAVKTRRRRARVRRRSRAR